MGFKKPAEIAEVVACSIGVSKCQISASKMIVLAIFAGVYIGFGAILSTTVTQGVSAHAGLGMAKFLGGATFSVGLMLVVCCGAELFTGNNLIITSKLEKEISWYKLFKNWTLVYIGNFIGSMMLVFIYFYSRLWEMNNCGLGVSALNIAVAKVNLPWYEAFFRGILCNILVCLAVWMAVSAENTIGKIAACFFPIMAFVTCGFEHSVANMYFIPIGILLKSSPKVSGLSTAGAHTLTWNSFLYNNLIPVTLGNIVGGALFVGMIYWYMYRRNMRK